MGNLDNIEILSNLIEKLSFDYSKKLDRQISTADIFCALFILHCDKNNLRWAGDFWDLELTYPKSVDLLDEFNFDTLKQQIQTDKSILPSKYIKEEKVLVKSKGLVWTIHKYDKDPFPSNPHAHLIDENIKLDLSNGKCYKARKYIYTLKKKELFALRTEINKKFDGLLPELAV